MAASKPDLARAGTMQVTAKSAVRMYRLSQCTQCKQIKFEEGSAFLDKNLTEWKKPYLMDSNANDTEDSAASGSTPKLSKHTTMKGTAQEAEAILAASGKPDEDAHTRGQQKKIEDISAEKPPAAKKPRMSKDSTMVGTAKEAKTLLAGEKLSDTRQETKRKQKSSAGNLKRATTMDKVKAEAELLYGKIDTGSGRSLRKRAPPPKPAMKKAGTMQKTAKEGKAFLKRSKKTAKKEEDIPEEEEDDKEDDDDEDISD